MNLKTILVLDDNDLYRSVLTHILTKKRCKVTSFSDPGSYLATRKNDHCETNCPCVDFILTDNHMPSMTGLEFLEWGKKNCKLPAHRKAIISAQWTEKDLDRAQKLGCQVFEKSSPLDHIHEWIDKFTE